MDTTNNISSRTIITTVVVIVIGIAALLVFRSQAGVGHDTATVATSTSISATSTSSTATTTSNGVSGTGHFVVKMVGTAPAAPDYKSPLVCASTVSTQCEQLRVQAATVEAQIAKNVQNFMPWINLGTIRKSAGDYVGAIKAWQYISILYPTNPTAFANLGDLYANYVKNYAKAESNYLRVIALYPADTSSYTNLFTMYTTTTYSGKPGAAEDILKKGIAANPQAVNMQVILARYYKSLGRTADAKATYAAAVANAQTQGNQTLATQIQQEASSN